MDFGLRILDLYENTHFCHSCESENPVSFVFTDEEQSKDAGSPIGVGDDRQKQKTKTLDSRLRMSGVSVFEVKPFFLGGRPSLRDPRGAPPRNRMQL